MPKTTKEILAELVEAEKVANTAIETIEYKFRGGWGMKIAGAKEDLPLLKAKYKESLADLVAAKVGISDITPEFKDAVTASYPSVGVEMYVVDGEGLYKALVDSFWTTMGERKEFMSLQYNYLNDLVQQVTRQLDVHYTGLELPVTQFLSYDHALEVIEASIKTVYGKYLNKLFVEQRVAELAFADKAVDPFIVMVTGPDTELVEFLFGKNTVNLKPKKFVAKGVINQEKLKEFFTTITNDILNPTTEVQKEQ